MYLSYLGFQLLHEDASNQLDGNERNTLGTGGEEVLHNETNAIV